MMVRSYVINKWVKKCTKYEVEGVGPRSRRKRTWKVEVVERDVKINQEYDLVHSKWR